MLKGIVWYKNIDNGLEMYKKIMQRYEFINIEIEAVGKNCEDGAWFVAGNGDTWRLCKAEEYRRLERCNVSYIEKCIEAGYVNEVIKHVTTGAPYNALNYYS